MDEPVRVGLVGCGGISRSHVRGLQVLKEAGVCNLEFVACCDISLESANRRAAQLKAIQGKEVSVYERVEDMLERERSLEATDICTDHASHHTIAVKCLEAGKHVLVEKPLAITVKAARLILDAARKYNRALSVAENYRRLPGNRAINWCLRKGMVGKPSVMMWVEASYGLGYWAWRHERVRAGGGWILDGGVHFADLFMYNLGPIEEVYAVTRTLSPTRYEDWPMTAKPRTVDVEDLSFATLKFENGATGLWAWTQVAPGEGVNHRAIYGERGSISWNRGLTILGEKNVGQYTMSAHELVRKMLQEMSEEEKNWMFPGGIGTKSDPWSFELSMPIQLWDFANSLRESRKFEVDGEIGLRDQVIPISIYESATLGTPVKTKDVETGRVSEYQERINRKIGLE